MILKLLKWQPDDRLLDSYFSILLREDVNPLWNTSSVGNVTEGNTAIIENILSNKIIELGYRSERDAFEFYKNDVSLVTYGYLNWIRDIHTYQLLEKVTDEVINNCANHMTAVANLIQEMDLGIIAMQIAVEQDTCVTIMRAGEQALFEEPRRFKKFIPVLVSLEQDYKDYENIMFVKLQEFVKLWNKRRGKKDITVEQLMTFWKHQNESGQDMKSWLINFEPHYLNPDTEESDISQMIENMSDEIEIQDCYLSLGWGVQ